MERDGLQSALQRTMEESRRLVLEGDEQVEKITRESERRAWYECVILEQGGWEGETGRHYFRKMRTISSSCKLVLYLTPDSLLAMPIFFS